MSNNNAASKPDLKSCAAPDWCRGRCECYSKPEPQAQCRKDGRCQYAIDHGAEGLGHCPPGKCAMPEPQEQAAEPNGCSHGVTGYCTQCKRNESIAELREAIAKKDAALKEQAMQYVSLFGQLQEAREEIAKLHTALDACVEAMRIAITQNGHDMLMTGEEQRIAIAAITKAQEAMK